MILALQRDETETPDARHHPEDRVVGTTEGVYCNMKFIALGTIILPDILYTVCIGRVKHLMDRVTFFLEQHSTISKLNQRWAKIRPYHGFTPLNKLYSKVTQWSGKKMKGLGCVIVSVLVATVLTPLASQRLHFTETLLYVKNIIYFHPMTQYWYHTAATIEYMKNYLKEFHWQKDIVIRFRAGKSTKKVSEVVEMPLLCTKRCNERVIPLGIIILRLHCIIVLI